MGIERDDLILPKWRLPANEIPFKYVKFEIVDKKIRQKILEIIKPAKVLSSDKKRDIDIEKNVEDELLTHEEIKIKKGFFLKRQNRKQLLRDSYFLYDVSSIVKESFITELNKFLVIFGSMTYFKEKKRDLIDLISPTNTCEFNMEKDTIKNSMELQIPKVIGQHSEIVDKKNTSFLFFKDWKKRKREMYVVDFVIIRGQQSFGKQDQLNPIEIKKEEDRIIIFYGVFIFRQYSK